MTEHSLLTILHLSDFHYSKRKHREQGIVIDALISDLERICIGHRKPDIVLFTGDLVQAAGVDLHDDAYDFLIDRVSKATGCSDERIFITPGNHDLSWTGLEQHSNALQQVRALLGTSQEADELNALHERGEFDAPVNAKFANYLELERFLNGDPRHQRRRLSTAFATVDYIAELNVDIVIFNSAVLSAGGHKAFDRDDRQLAIPEYAIMEVVKHLTPGSFRIFATHHPLSSLSESSAKYFEGQLSTHAHVHLFGHMHDPQPRKLVGLKGEVISNQAGALFTARKTYYNGYSLITVDRSLGECETLVRSYFKERDEFDEGVDIIEGGRWWSSNEARQAFHKIATPVDDRAFRTHLAGAALQALLEREKVTDGENNLHDRFVAPPLRRTFIKEVSGDEAKVEFETPVVFTDMIEGDANLILYARSEFGRTTLLKELRYRFLNDANSVRFPRLPTMIDFREISSNADNMLRKVRGSSEAAPVGNDVESLLKLGHAVIIIDDVQFGDAARMKILREFVRRFPKSRYILSSPHSSATKLGACIDPEMPLRFEFVEIRELRRSDMRKLLAKEERCTDVEEWLDRLQDEFREINLPFTAANGSILIEILSEKYHFRPINRAVLMEQFVDSTLQKAAVDESRRETFDYTNKTDLLSHLAAWMARSGNYGPNREDLRAEMKSYLDARGLNVNLTRLLSEFLSARILIEGFNDCLGFRYRGVREYFIALRMTSDPEFKAWVLDDGRYLTFMNEINYYAGKVRNDSELLELVAERHQHIVTASEAEIGKIALSDFDTLQLPGEKAPADIDGLERALIATPMSKEEKDSELEADDFDQTEGDHRVSRAEFEKAADKLSASLLLYSGLVKNMELITDGQKRKHLKHIWAGWATVLMVSLGYVPKLAKERRIRIGHALYEVQAPQGMAKAVLIRKMMLLLPHLHIKLLAGTLGTEKLERQLTEPSMEEIQDEKIIRLLRAGVISELRLNATPATLGGLAAELSGNFYLLWALIVHIGELRRLDRVKEEHYRSLEIPLAGAIADLRGGSPKTRANIKRQQLARLEKDRLLLSIKRDQDRRA